MSWNNIIPFDAIIEGGVWKPSSVEETPGIELSRWIVYEVPSLKEGMPKDHHFCGWNVTEGEGRVSSKIVEWNRETRTGTTRSGRRYKLVGESALNMDAAYVWDKWKRINKVEDYSDVSDQYEENAPIPPVEQFNE